MRRTAALPLILFVAIIGSLLSCGQEERPVLVDDLGLGEYTDSTLDFPMMQYADGELTINDRCPVRKALLNRRLAPLFVNGRPLGFC